MNGPVDVRAIDVVAAIKNCAAYLREEMGLIKAADQMGAVGAAVAELIETGHHAEVAFNTVRYCYERNPGNFAIAMSELDSDIAPFRAALARVGAK